MVAAVPVEISITVGVGLADITEVLASTDDGKSTGSSSIESGSSVCNPRGLSGSLRVPLFGFGWIPKESQMML